MPTSILRSATSRPKVRRADTRASWRLPLDAAVIVLLFSALFAGSVLIALHVQANVDVDQASVQGGL